MSNHFSVLLPTCQHQFFFSWMEKIDTLATKLANKISPVNCFYTTIQNDETVAKIAQALPPAIHTSVKLRINKYTGGQSLGMHCDNQWFADATHVAIAYLNDNYEGGELVVLDNQMQHIETIKPKQNQLIVLPLDYFHYTNPITSGVKYCLATQFALA